ncbi:hypothetical protein PBY51_022914 [Eleginops maclovinus]|uniref:Uncharacterized protein n=1 Tax=Eleginops maclovinus TaxID=56733 RepID=A0AAN8AIS7_ELEMC|nr:hypothetical protein PBY51_022914 [Eleginops maclovinus]
MDVDRCLCVGQLTSPQHRVNCVVVSQAASYLQLRKHRGKRSAKRPRAGEGDDANRLSLLTWSRGSSLRDLVSRIHGSGAGSTVRSGGRKERVRWRSSDRHFLIAHYCRSDPVNLWRAVQDADFIIEGH